jgi:hypothetical protein
MSEAAVVGRGFNWSFIEEAFLKRILPKALVAWVTWWCSNLLHGVR